MPETNTVDEVVNTRFPSRAGAPSRPMHEETVHAQTGESKSQRNGVEDDNHDGGGKRGRVFKESTTKMLEGFEKEETDARSPAQHEEGDPDEDEEGDDADEASAPDGDAGDDAGEDGGESDDAEGDEGATEGDGEEEGEGEEKPDPSAEWQAKAQTLEQRNRELIGELETARKTPKSQRSERETALVAAESAYIEEGSVPALRKFLSVIVGAAPDSKEVTEEIRGIFSDLTAQELGVPLDANQQALRDNARTRLLLARDRREKAEAGKKPEVDNSADTVQYETAAKHIENLLVQSGTSLADEYPMLNNLAKDFDGYTPGEVIARAVRQEIMTGTLDANTNEIEMVRTVGSKIETYYEGLGKKINAALAKKTKKPDTTTPSGKKPKVAVEASKEQRHSQGARTITNAAASRAPAKTPKVQTKQKAQTTTEKTRKDFPSEAAWKDHLFAKHFKA